MRQLEFVTIGDNHHAMDPLVDIPPADAAIFSSVMGVDSEDYIRCVGCGVGGCDVRIQGCGCTLHSRCIGFSDKIRISACVKCRRPTTGFELLPMVFRELDEARKANALSSSSPSEGPVRRGTKRKQIDADGAEKGEEHRTGRWTTEEMRYCDKLIASFESGKLPLTTGTKLNEFLGTMLKSKQSRLTKKMKNAKLSTKSFTRKIGFLQDPREAREFSQAEEAFFKSIQDPMERAEVKFGIQKMWREQFSALCVSAGQPLDGDAWLKSIEEMDRRSREAKDAARVARRKLMTGYALKTDASNQDRGVFIEKANVEAFLDASEAEAAKIVGVEETGDVEELLSLLTEKAKAEEEHLPFCDTVGKSSALHMAPFLDKAISYIEKANVPFEHIDLWVPSFVPGDLGSLGAGPLCRLCFAGCATVESNFDLARKTRGPLSREEKFNLLAFGDYSQKFSFDVGCGLPGRVYQSGLPTWEQSIQRASHQQFERGGGARQWGINTVVGIPIASPNVGRIVVTLYSRHDRPKDQDLVRRLSEEFTKMMPSPKWKLVVDVGDEDILEDSPEDSVTLASQIDFLDAFVDDTEEEKKEEVVALLGEHMPSDPTSPHYTYLQGFMSLRLMLLRPNKSNEENEMTETILGSYSSYSEGDRPTDEIAMMLARDYLFLSAAAQQLQQESQPHLQIGQCLSTTGPASGPPSVFSFFALPASDTTPFPSCPSSPSLAPINPGSGPDTASIVSN